MSFDLIYSTRFNSERQSISARAFVARSGWLTKFARSGASESTLEAQDSWSPYLKHRVTKKALLAG